MVGSALALTGGLGLTAACGAKSTDNLVDAAAAQAQRRAEIPCIRPITMAAVGDVLLHDAFQRWAAVQPEGFFAAMEPVKDLIEGADVAVANLEGPAAANIAGQGLELPAPATRYDGNIYKGYPLFNYHPSIVTDLRRMGFDALQNANNHAMDRGPLGVDRTIQALDAARMPHTGTRLQNANPANFDWSTSYTVRRDGHDYRFAFVACSYGTNGVPDPRHQVLKCFDDRAELLGTIRRLRADPTNAAVIVMPHWGVEYQPLPNSDQMGLAQAMADAGATAIIGTHPHVVQPERMLTASDGRGVPVVYSLGNFVSYQQGLPRLATVIYMLGFTPAADGRLAATMTGWIPLRMQTGATMRIDPIDRISAAAGAPYLAHLSQTFRAANRLPADPARYWNRAAPPVCAAGPR